MQAERVAPERLVAERVEAEDLATAQDLDDAARDVALVDGGQGLHVARHPLDVGGRIVGGEREAARENDSKCSDDERQARAGSSWRSPSVAHATQIG